MYITIGEKQFYPSNNNIKNNNNSQGWDLSFILPPRKYDSDMWVRALIIII